LAASIPAPDGTENELGRLLDAFLRTLDTDSRLIFLRRYYWCDSVETIATLTGRSPSGITSLLFRTRQKLRRYLEQEGYAL
jgi:RNA polymerase sigma-70 factor (ECF subfamily)